MHARFGVAIMARRPAAAETAVDDKRKIRCGAYFRRGVLNGFGAGRALVRADIEIGQLAVLRAKAMKDADRFDRTQGDEPIGIRALLTAAQDRAAGRRAASDDEVDQLLTVLAATSAGGWRHQRPLSPVQGGLHDKNAKMM